MSTRISVAATWVLPLAAAAAAQAQQVTTANLSYRSPVSWPRPNFIPKRTEVGVPYWRGPGGGPKVVETAVGAARARALKAADTGRLAF